MNVGAGNISGNICFEFSVYCLCIVLTLLLNFVYIYDTGTTLPSSPQTDSKMSFHAFFWRESLTPFPPPPGTHLKKGRQFLPVIAYSSKPADNLNKDRKQGNWEKNMVQDGPVAGTVWKDPGFLSMCFNSPVAGTVWKGPAFLSMCFQLTSSGHRVEGPWISLYVFSTHL